MEISSFAKCEELINSQTMSVLTRIFHPLWVLLIYLPLAVVSLAVAVFGVVLLTPFFGRSRTYRWCAVNWARLLVALLPMKIEVVGEWPRGILRDFAAPELASKSTADLTAASAASAKPYVVVANHQSQFDIPVLLKVLGLDLCWVMKQEIKLIPLVGIGATMLGNIAIDRKNGEKARSQIAAAVQKMSGDVGLMFFPEGTRSRDVPLLPYKSGAFRIAIQQQMPILPVTIVGTRNINPAGTFWLRPGCVKVMVHPPIRTEGLDERHVGDVQKQVRAWTLAQVERFESR
jgi:1-acyl-sn-glycerol-3-phosphate acyltransferase